MPLLARTALLRQQALRPRVNTQAFRARQYHHLPFAWPTNKGVWGAKVAIYLTTAFSIPFFATWFQLRKAAQA